MQLLSQIPHAVAWIFLGLLLISIWAVRQDEKSAQYWAMAYGSYGCGVVLLHYVSAEQTRLFAAVLTLAPAAYVMFMVAASLRLQERRLSWRFVYRAILLLWVVNFTVATALPSIAVVLMGALSSAATVYTGVALLQRGRNFRITSVLLYLQAGLLLAAAFTYQLDSQAPVLRVLRYALAALYPLLAIGLTNVVLKESDARLLDQAHRDGLTGLVNRTYFEASLDAARRSRQPHSLLLVRLDGLRLVNSVGGHAAGDEVLRGTGHLLTSMVTPHDMVARLGGDEFGLLLHGGDPQAAVQVGELIVRALHGWRTQWAGSAYRVGASVGVATIDGNASLTELLGQADIACHVAKVSGRNQVCHYDDESGEARSRQREAHDAVALRDALAHGRLCLYVQPIVALRRGLPGRTYEVLLRVQDPATGDVLPPGALIAAAERFDLMGEVDRWVLEELLIHSAPRLAAMDDDIRFHVNVSANSLGDASFGAYLKRLVADSQLKLPQLTFEITETALIARMATAANLVKWLRAEGAHVALDDFGVGMSSFDYLREFTVDEVKIDGRFINNLPESEVDRTIVSALNDIAHRLGARTVAEFVDTTEKLEILRGFGVDFAQGYAVGLPQPLAALEALMSPREDESPREGDGAPAAARATG